MLAGPAVDPRVFATPQPVLDTGDGLRLRPWTGDDAPALRAVYAVSYTHLTLPTILLV